MELKRMKKGRVPGIDEVCTEMIIAAEEVRASWTKRLLNICMTEGSFSEEWRTGLIGPMEKGDAQYPGKSRGITLLSCNKVAGEDSLWEDKEEWGGGDWRRTAVV